MSCEFAHDDGSYVMGALSPAERQRFEEHLAGCSTCAASVRELAGMPGLLARVDADVLESPPVDEPVPDTLLPALVREVRRTQRRRTFVTAGLAAAAAVTVVAGTLTVAGTVDGGGATPTASVHVGRAMEPVGSAPVRARVAFENVPWGTRLEVTCTYAPGPRGYPATPARYALFVHTRDGRTEQVATWKSLPGRTMRLAAATAASRKQISSVEVRTADGEPVLRLAA